MHRVLQGKAVAAMLLTLTTLTHLDFAHHNPATRSARTPTHGPASGLATVLPMLRQLKILSINHLLRTGDAATALCAALPVLQELTELHAKSSLLPSQRMQYIGQLTQCAPCQWPLFIHLHRVALQALSAQRR